nr:reverse transcriptase domain-containing protein [Tanacetum cinerariifolium]
MFIDKYFPPSMVTKLRNEITNFRQRPNESLFETWECYKLSIDRCPNHNMLPVTQIDTFYNGLTLRHRDTINAAAGGTFMKRRPEECCVLIKNITAHHNNWVTSAQRSESSSSITSSFDTKITALKAEMTEINKNIMRVLQVNQQVKAVTPNYETCGGPHSFSDCPATVGNTQNVYAARAYQGNTITNPKEDLKDITTRIGTLYHGPTIPTTSCSIPLVVERETEATKDTVHPTNNGSTEDVQPSIVPTDSPKEVARKIGDPGKFLILCDIPGMAECLALANLGASINLMPLSVWNKLSLPDLSPTCMTLELAGHSISRPVGVVEDVFVKVGTFHFPADFVVVDFDADPRVPLILGRSFLKTKRALIDVFEAKTDKSSIDEPLEVELRDLPPHLKYVFLEGDDKFPVIITKDLSVEEKTTLITVLKSHKRAIACKLSDIKGIHPNFYTQKILMEEDFEPTIQHQRRVNPKIHDVIKNEVLKLLDAGLIYPISDSPWVNPVQCVPKKGSFTVVENEENELIPTRLVTGWCMCIDYRKLNEATRKDHFPLPFMYQMLERLAGNQYYCFLRWFLWVFPNSHRSERSGENHIYLSSSEAISDGGVIGLAISLPLYLVVV